MPLPPAHMLVGAAAAEGVGVLTPVPRYRAWIFGAVFALLPDIDFGFRLLTGEYAPIERSATHSLLATAIVALAVWVVAGRRWAAVAGAGYASHLVADVMQHQPRSSVALFWPLQEQGMETVLPLFPYVPVHRGDGALGAAALLLHGYSFAALLQETAIAAAVFFGMLVLSGWVRGRQTPVQERKRRTRSGASG